jgi:SAM-dependent methyltransferase
MDVIQEISPDDDMFLGNREHYFHVGESAIECIMSAIFSTGKDPKEIKNILDLPCGYGRVLRYLKATFPEASLTACDIGNNAVDFCTQTMGSFPVYSRKEIKQVFIDRNFDLIWVGSLFTHLDLIRWDDFIEFFSSKLNPDGLLVISFHGPSIVQNIINGTNTYGLSPNQLISLLGQYILKQYAFVNYQNIDDYGISISSPVTITSIFEKFSELSVISLTEKAWDDHQDILICQKKNPIIYGNNNQVSSTDSKAMVQNEKE